MFTWHFEYIHKNGEEIQNVWLQRSYSNKFVLFECTHWDLYPEEHKTIIELKQKAKKCCNNEVLHNENGCKLCYFSGTESRTEEEKILLEKIANLENVIIEMNNERNNTPVVSAITSFSVK